jgi:hypothetical protein
MRLETIYRQTKPNSLGPLQILDQNGQEFAKPRYPHDAT